MKESPEPEKFKIEADPQVPDFVARAKLIRKIRALGYDDTTAAHFARWVETLEHTVDARAAGPHAQLMKSLGHRIAYSMQVRLGIHPFEPYAAGDPEVVRLDRRPPPHPNG